MPSNSTPRANPRNGKNPRCVDDYVDGGDNEDDEENNRAETESPACVQQNSENEDSAGSQRSADSGRAVRDNQEKAESLVGDLPSYKDQVRGERDRVDANSINNNNRREQTPAAVGNMVIPSFKDQVATSQEARDNNSIAIMEANADEGESQSSASGHFQSPSSIVFADAQVLPSSTVAPMEGGVWNLPSDVQIQTGNTPPDRVRNNKKDTLKSLLIPKTEKGRCFCRIGLLLLAATVVGLVVYVIVVLLNDKDDKTPLESENGAALTAVPVFVSSGPIPSLAPTSINTPTENEAFFDDFEDGATSDASPRGDFTKEGNLTAGPLLAYVTEDAIAPNVQAVITYINSISLKQGANLQYPAPVDAFFRRAGIAVLD